MVDNVKCFMCRGPIESIKKIPNEEMEIIKKNKQKKQNEEEKENNKDDNS